jgi:hypothetical protein
MTTVGRAYERSFSVALPASFVLGCGFPTSAEMAYGFSERFLSRSGVVDVALAKLEAGFELSPAEERIALLLSDEFDRVDKLVDDLHDGSEPLEKHARFWLLLVLAWVLEHRDEFDDPLGVVELVYADFDYPEEIEGLVRFMPLQPSQEGGVAALMRRWGAFVDRVTDEYRERGRSMIVAQR